MTFDNSILFFFCALGVFNCLLTSIYFLFFQRNPEIKNTLFGLLTLLLSIRIGKTVFMSFEGSMDLLIAQIGLSACFLIGPCLYFYVKAYLEKRESIPRSWLFHFGILFCLVLLVGLFKPYSNHIAFWNNYFVWCIYLIWGIYLLASAYELRSQLYSFFAKDHHHSTSHSWLVLILAGNILIFISYLVGYFWLYFVEMLTFSVIFYAITFFYLSRKDRHSIFRKVPEKYARKKINPAEAQSLQIRLEQLMQKEELYKNPNLKLEELASSLRISQHKLSQLLNDNMGESFSSYINRYRVENAIQLLAGNNIFTLEAIGYESGFTSKSGFYSTFKKRTGTTPSRFRKSMD